MTTTPTAAQPAGQADPRSALQPSRGLTFILGDRAANVHEVTGGQVYWGIYTEGQDMPDALCRYSVDGWTAMVAAALARGAVPMTRLRA